MAALTWTPTLALQQPRMDDTHREFVDLLNGVDLALADEGSALAQALDDFVRHTEAHFAQEDDWMQQVGFDTQNCHSFQHAQVLELVREVRRRLHEDADVDVVRALVPALAEWFPIHAQSMDAGLVQSMQEAGFDPDAFAAPTARVSAA
ncbi:MAG: hemerythrin domain-containing protein [Rubrivivax sp.]|nr:hemerythrin domain-containing protein [Rubrivivax sp.]